MKTIHLGTIYSKTTNHKADVYRLTNGALGARFTGGPAVKDKALPCTDPVKAMQGKARDYLRTYAEGGL